MILLLSWRATQKPSKKSAAPPRATVTAVAAPSPKRLFKATQAPLVLRHRPRGRFVVLDFETTGLDPAYGARIIEVSAREIVNGEPQRELCTLVDPGFAVPSFITSLTGITTAMVRGAPRSAEVMSELAAFLGDSTVVAHNASFDMKFLQAESEASPGGCLCTLLLSRRLFPDRGGYSLSEISRSLGIKLLPGMHRASADTFVTTLLFEQIYGHAKERCGGRELELSALEKIQRLTKKKVEGWFEGQA